MALNSRQWIRVTVLVSEQILSYVFDVLLGFAIFEVYKVLKVFWGFEVCEICDIVEVFTVLQVLEVFEVVVFSIV